MSQREPQSTDEMAQFDWTKATRGRHAERAAKASALLRVLDADLAERFPDSRSVNEALRALLSAAATVPRQHRAKSKAA